MLTCLPTAKAASEPQKEEVIYAALKPNGQAEEAYVVNIFPGGAVTDYGNYTSVRMMNTEDTVTYLGGLVSFVTAESRVYYQGNLSQVELPWLFTLEWKLNGQSVSAEQMAGAWGKMEMRLSIRQNPARPGNFFDTHALQITASLDTDRCTNITAEGATQANVGPVRQLNWIILPGTESEVVLTADVTDFEMPALSINGVRMQLDPGDEVIEDVLSLVDGLEELSSHNEELTDGAKQLVQAAFDTANDELQANKKDFDMLGITLNTLTTENYDEEITRLQEELLDKVDDFVLQQAEQQLYAQVNSVAAGMVRTEVEKAARVQVEQEVRKGAEAQVREAVTAEARKQVEAAIRNPNDADIDALVETQMQSAEVQGIIDEIVEAQMASPEVQAQINAEIEAIARPQVEAAVEAEVRRQVEAGVRQPLRSGIEKGMEAKIRMEVTQEMGGSGWWPTFPTEKPDITEPTAPSEDGTEPSSKPTESTAPEDPSGEETEPSTQPTEWPTFPTLPTFPLPTEATTPENPSEDGTEPSTQPTERPTLPTLPTIPLPTEATTPENPSGGETEPSTEPTESTAPEHSSGEETEPSTEPTQLPTIPTLPTIPSPTETTAAEDSSEKGTEPSAEATEQSTLPTLPIPIPTEASSIPTELPTSEEVLEELEKGTIPTMDSSSITPDFSPVSYGAPSSTSQFVYLSHTTLAGENTQQIEAEVAARMASQEVQQQIEALTDAAFASDTTQAMIDAQVSSQMQSPEVQAIIEAEVAAQVANPDNRAQAEAVARKEVRTQVEAAVREQVRAAILAKLNTMTEDEVNAMVDEQMQSEAVQQRIEDETAAQKQSAAVQVMMDAEIEKQWKSDEVKALIDAECAKQLQSVAVQGQISSEIANQRNSAAYLNAVAQALEENGENGAAYQALVTLRETLDDLMDFYNGIIDYTEGVQEAATGVSNARKEVGAMLGDTDDDASRDTVSFTSEKNGQVKSVQFVLTIPAIEKPEPTVAELTEAEDETFIGRLVQLFK